MKFGIASEKQRDDILPIAKHTFEENKRYNLPPKYQAMPPPFYGQCQFRYPVYWNLFLAQLCPHIYKETSEKVLNH